ncbi:hypothetical protein ElyMa_001341800 [Elysia marginata]|uniref:Uncharacterized protein n=1 Tax=Elysia marginata TaxID=1093978 RepID=A0AAV4IM66_9GAST|nr:hypothetical protein ElyMa_001341800 [Elysia marginata]
MATPIKDWSKLEVRAVLKLYLPGGPPDGGPARPLYLSPPAALTAPGEGGRFGCIKTSGDNGHPRGSAIKADPRSVSISPLSESSEAGAPEGGALGGGWGALGFID